MHQLVALCIWYVSVFWIKCKDSMDFMANTFDKRTYIQQTGPPVIWTSHLFAICFAYLSNTFSAVVMVTFYFFVVVEFCFLALWVFCICEIGEVILPVVYALFAVYALFVGPLGQLSGNCVKTGFGIRWTSGLFLTGLFFFKLLLLKINRKQYIYRFITSHV